MRRAFTLVEVVVVLVVVGVAAAAGLAATSVIINKARRVDQAQEALAQIRKLRAQALVVNETAVVATSALPGGGVRVTTATVKPAPSLPQCLDFRGRASRLEEHDYDLLDIRMDRPSNTLCFEPAGFRLLAEDQTTLAPAPAHLDVLVEGTTTSLGTLDVAPLGTFTSSFAAGVDEGLSATVNLPAPTPADDPSRNVVEPKALEPELPVAEAPPPDPTTPPGQPPIEALPTPSPCPPPPPTPACTTDADCGAGFQCQSNTCVDIGASCNSDSDCPEVDFGCNLTTHECTKPCNQSLCPSAPHTCGGCQGASVCCTVYSCLCL